MLHKRDVLLSSASRKVASASFLIAATVAAAIAVVGYVASASAGKPRPFKAHREAHDQIGLALWL